MNPCLLGSIKAGKVAVYQILLQSAFTCRQTVFNPSLSLCAGSTSQLLSNLVSEPKNWNSPPPFHQIDDSSPLSHQMVRAFSLRWLCMSRSVENPSLGLYLLQKTSGGQRHRNTRVRIPPENTPSRRLTLPSVFISVFLDADDG